MKYTNTINLLLLIVILSIHLQARAADKIDFTNPLVSGFLTPQMRFTFITIFKAKACDYYMG
jgi:hypothetical protein